MMARPPSHRFEFRQIAATGARFSGFSPYVASINGTGLVAFQAALSGGGSGVFAGSGGAVERLDAGAAATIYSHPDINDAGDVSFYAESGAGVQGVHWAGRGGGSVVTDASGGFGRVGPLGPTMNEAGTVAFRAVSKAGRAGIFVRRGAEAPVTVAESGDRFESFHGLPVINRHGTVVFRADLKDGSKGIFAGNGGDPAAVAGTGGPFGDLALFPDANDSGTVAFCATLKSGGDGVFTVAEGRLTTRVADRRRFEGFRSALINNPGRLLFFATPVGGALGLFAGPDPDADRIIGLGDPLEGSIVKDVAANPVSLNDAGLVALRVRLADGRELIIRADPTG